MKKKVTKKGLYIVAVLALNLFLVSVFVLPYFSFAKHDEIFVNAKASGKQNGSAAHPYKTISAALEKASKKDKIFVAAGTYKENIKIDDGIGVFGSDRSAVIIEAKNDDKPVVEMDDKTEINKVTIRKGKVGIQIGKDDAKISIVNVIIEDNERDGVRVKRGSTSKKESISVTDSVIRDNGKSGIFSEKNRLVLIDNEIYSNDREGIELEAGSSAWVEGNRIKDNKGSGMKLALDGSDIWTKNNTVRDNEREGIEINSYGGYGRIDISKSKFVDNERYGVARVQRVINASTVWSGLTFDNRNTFDQINVGTISPVIKIVK